MSPNQPVEEEIRITVRVTPRGGADRVDGVGAQGELRVRVNAAPADGAANEAVTRLLADTFGVTRASVRVVRGHAARSKVVAIRGVAATEPGRRWPGVLTTGR